MKIPSLENEATLRDAGLLMLRVIVGGTFLVHGIDKLIDLSATESYFASLDIPAPGLMAPFVAVTETAGGALLLLGLATRLVGPALAGDMLVALLTEHIGDGFFADEGGIEFPLLLGSASVVLVLTGAGRFSTDAAFGVERRLFELVTRPSRRGGSRPNRLSERNRQEASW
jgi:putative oxidoreductase